MLGIDTMGMAVVWGAPVILLTQGFLINVACMPGIAKRQVCTVVEDLRKEIDRVKRGAHSIVPALNG